MVKAGSQVGSGEEAEQGVGQSRQSRQWARATVEGKSRDGRGLREGQSRQIRG